MIGDITMETACAVSGAPFERVSQYLKRGQFKLETETEAGPGRRKKREWSVRDVLKLAVIQELSGIVPISRCSELIVKETKGLAIVWDKLSDGTVMDSGATQQYLIASAVPSSKELRIQTADSKDVARGIVFPAGQPGARVALVLDLLAIARDVRRKLEAMGE